MGRSMGRVGLAVLCAALSGIFAGCAEAPHPQSLHHSLSVPASTNLVSEAVPPQQSQSSPSVLHDTPSLLLAANRTDEDNRSATSASTPEEPYDPFATPSDTVDEYDPWESFNIAMFEVNRKIDKYALKPIAQAYDFVLPHEAQRGVDNFFYNLRTPPRLFNKLFQGKVKAAGIELGRFMLNTTFGLGGFVDVAKYMQIQTPDEDFGQTLGYYGVPPGPYLVLPLFPPFTLRDVTGYVMDLALNPLNWLVFPLIEVEGIPSLVSHPNRTTTTIVQLSARAAYIINERALTLESFQGVEEATVDLYSAVRNAYLQRRARQVRE